MAILSEQTIERVRNSADIVEVISKYTSLKKKGQNHFGLCPFHQEKTPSFSVSEEKQIFKCFGCGEGGNVINFIMKKEGLEFVDSIESLADQFGIKIEYDKSFKKKQGLKNQVIDMNKIASLFWDKSLFNDIGSKARSYLEERKISMDDCKKLGIGYSPKTYTALLDLIRQKKFSSESMKSSGLFIDGKKGYIDRFRNRIMFNICNPRGEIIAFAGRIFNNEDTAKYMNSPETPFYNKSSVLYGFHLSKNLIKEMNQVIVVEGYMDYIQLYLNGIKNVVAVSGTALTNQHASMLGRYSKNIYLCYDGDKAGISAAIRAGFIALQTELNPLIINLPDGQDPDDYVNNHGSKKFMELKNNATKLIDFIFSKKNMSKMTDLGKSNLIKKCCEQIAQIPNPVFREITANSLSSVCGYSIESITELINNISNKQPKKNVDTSEQINSRDQQSNFLVENDLLLLCLTKDPNIRKFIFEKANPDYFRSKSIKIIFEKIYIHLNSEHQPDPGIIMNELENDSHRKKLSELSFNLEKIDPSIEMAYECLERIEKFFLIEQIEKLRAQLKDGNETEEMINQINDYQNQLNRLKAKYADN